MPQDGWFTSGNARLHYVEWPGSGPAILCIPGITAGAHNFSALAERLSPQYRVIVIELRGRGLSDRPAGGPYGLLTHVQDVVGLIGELKLAPVSLFGHSFGGYVVALLASRHPELVSHHIMMDGGGLAPGDAENVLAQIKPALDRLGYVFPSWDAYLAVMSRAPFVHLDNPYWLRYLEADVERRPDGSLVSRISAEAVAADVPSTINDYDMESVLPRVQAPSLVMHAPLGTIDPSQPLMATRTMQRIAELLRAPLLTIAGANHYDLAFDPPALDQVAAHVRQFLG